MNGLGPTGKFPQGKLDDTDEGELTLAVSVVDSVIRIDFGKKVAWLGLDPDTALALASSLTEKAMALKLRKSQ